MSIAFDAASSGSYANTTWTHTCSGANRVLFVLLVSDVSIISATVTYNGVSMTSLDSTGSVAQLFMLLNPTIGANSIVITTGAAHYRGIACSYTGVAQTGQPDSIVSSGIIGSTPSSITNTVIAANCWIVSFGGAAYSGVTPTVNTGRTSRVNTLCSITTTPEYIPFCIEDSNGNVTAGSNTTTVTATGTGTFSWDYVCSVSMSPAPNSNGSFFAFFN